jgi:hypothetical protein
MFPLIRDKENLNKNITFRKLFDMRFKEEKINIE